MDLPEKITCVDCGQNAHMLSHAPEDGWEVGDIVAYRCSGCNDRWDLVVEDDSYSSGDFSSGEFAHEARQILEDRQNDAK